MYILRFIVDTTSVLCFFYYYFYCNHLSNFKYYNMINSKYQSKERFLEHTNNNIRGKWYDVRRNVYPVSNY